MGPDHPETATTLSNLALLHQAMGNHAAALPLATRALNIHEAVLGPDHPTTRFLFKNLAHLHKDMGNQTTAATGLVCAYCGTCGETGAMARCSRCKAVFYCSKSCQKKHWKAHKQFCTHK